MMTWDWESSLWLLPYEIAICVIAPVLVLLIKYLLKKYNSKANFPYSEEKQNPRLYPLIKDTTYDNAQYRETKKGPTLLCISHLNRIIKRLTTICK